MTPQERQRQIDRIFVEASRRSPGELHRYLDQACRALPEEVRFEVEKLLHSDEELISGRARFLDKMPVDIAHVLHLSDRVAERDGVEGQSDRATSSARQAGFKDTGELATDGVASAIDGPTSFASGRYLVKRILGQGGQKQVFLAVDSELDREVAVAVPNFRQENPQADERFRREAKALARLDRHPNIVRIFDFGDEGGQPYIVTEYMQGGSIAELQRERGNRPLAVSDAIQIAMQTSEALNHAHQHGIVHRDVKPANLWLTEHGTVKLGDFGVAALLDRSRLTDTRAAIGTATYLSPEQALSPEIGPASDLYSLGISIYELVTGNPPFRGDTALSVISQHLNASPVPPSARNADVPEVFEAFILQLLTKRVEDRTASAAAVTDALRTIAKTCSERDPAQGRTTRNPSARPLAPGVFVGREDELQELRVGLTEAIAGRGSLFIIEGEAGSGKTRTAQELSTYARLHNVEVLTGRCYDGKGAPAFWPWVQCIRSFASGRNAEQLVSSMGAGAADIAQMDRQIRHQLPDLPTPPSIEPDQARFRLFDSVSTFLRQAGKDRPLLLILDDLQWADEPSLRLLSFLAGDLGESRLFIIGTYRSEPESHPRLANLLGELFQVPRARRVQLSGLSQTEVARLIAETSAITPAESIVSAIWSKTEGNPFFVSEILRMLVADGGISDDAEHAQIGIPDGVREVIGRRLDSLPAECHRILGLASVIGREFPFDVIQRLCGEPPRHIMAVLDAAVEGRVLEDVRQDRLSYRFIHDLVRESIYGQLSKSKRSSTHDQVGCVLQELHAHDPEQIVTELAHHFFEAAQTGAEVKAIEYCERAGRQSMKQLAYEEAVRYFKMSLQTLERHDVKGLSRHCQLLLSLAEAQRQSGELAEAIGSFHRAADDARQLGQPDSLAIAAIGFAEASWNSARIGAPIVRLLEDALHELDESDGALRAKLLGALSQSLRYLGWLDAAEAPGRAALEMARRLQDSAVLAYVLYGELDKLWGSEQTDQGIACANEMLRLAEATGDKERTVAAHMWRICYLLDVGDVPEVKSSIQAHVRLSQELRQPYNLYVSAGYLAMQALLEGRFDDGEKLARKTVSLGNRIGADNAEGVFGLQMFTVRREQGRLQEIAPAVHRFVKRDLSSSVWGPGLAVIYADLGLRDHAKRQLEDLASEDFSVIPRDALWITCLSYLCDVCTFLGDLHNAQCLYDLIKPFAGRNVVVGGGVVCLGSTDRFLGQLAATLADWQTAEAHFRRAIDMNARAEARPWLAHTQYRYAEMLVARAAPSDPERAMSLMESARVTSQQLGMRILADRLIELEASIN